MLTDYFKKLDINIAKYNLALFLAASILLAPVLLLFYKENGLTVQDFFFFQGIVYLVSILVEIPIGYLADKYSRKTILTCSFSLLALISGLWCALKGFWIVLAGEILYAISKTMRDNTSSGYIYDYVKGNNMVKYYGYQNFFLAAGASLATISGTFLYIKFGYKNLLFVSAIIYFISAVLVFSLPKADAHKDGKIKLKEFFNTLKEIYENQSIKYYVFYSGFLTSLSILFALSFQPIMKNALFPVIFFGIISFINHSTRSLSGVFAGKFLRKLDINKLVIPLYLLYFLAFGCIFCTLALKNIFVIFLFLVMVCLIIDVQLAFTILHVSRLHGFVSIEKRGRLISVNNIISKSLSAIILISSKFFINNNNLLLFFIIAFVVFIFFGGGLVLKLKRGNR